MSSAFFRALPPRLLVFALCVLGAGCVQQTAGHEQHLELVLDGELPDFVVSAQVTVAAAELMPCDTTASRWLSAAADWLVPVAHAHSQTSALRIGTPQVISLLGRAGKHIPLGTFTPPPGNYCELHLMFIPADSDALGLHADAGGADTLYMAFDDGRDDWVSPGRLIAVVPLQPALQLDQPVREMLSVYLDRTLWWAAQPDSPTAALRTLTDALENR